MGTDYAKQMHYSVDGGTPLEECLTPNENEVEAPQPSHRPDLRLIKGDARSISEHIASNSVDLIVTSPPYWRKRDYGFQEQIGQEDTADEYVDQIIKALIDWRKVLRPSGSIFLNIGDTYYKRSLAGIPGRIEDKIRSEGWYIRNRIIWAKSGGMPDPAKNRLAPRHEYILFLVPEYGYYFDLFGYAHKYGNGANPGDVWHIDLERSMGKHLAPYPDELVERAITMACPYAVCAECGEPQERIVERTAQLDPSRPQARRAMEIARKEGLTREHIAAIQAVGISDAGKAKRFQNGTDRNSEEVQILAAQAKEVLGGYFREFTFAKRKTVGWSSCDCGCEETIPGVVVDPFMGTGTTLEVALRMRRSAIGVDLQIPEGFQMRMLAEERGDYEC